MADFKKSFPRDRDCYVLFKGDAYTVAVSDTMKAGGWMGGQGVQWTDSPRDEFIVTYSDGLYGGFMLWGSNEVPDGLTSMTGSQATYGYGVFCAGGWLIATRAFERYTYASRIGGGALVENTYQVGQRLVFSLRGLWTVEDEWTLSSDPRGSNGYFIGNIVQAPTADNNYYLTLQTSI
jgi:hypothetical protein